jgi:hypothetical protein
MKTPSTPTGRWIFGSIVTAIFAFFLGLSQDRNSSLPGHTTPAAENPASWGTR